jgi:hypothetical protein
VNTFEVAVLRVLIKRQQPLKLSTLVSGFPDNCEDNVLSAISSLKLQEYVMVDNYQPNGYVSINRERRKEILQIVDSDIYSHKLEAPHAKEKSSASIEEKKSLTQIATRYPISQGIRAIAISSLLIVGLVSALGVSMPTTSPDTEFVAHHQYTAHKKWSNAHGAGDHEGDMTSASPYYPSSSASFVALKDCNQKPLQQQT